MQKIISSLVILHYDQFSHPKLRRCLQGTSSCAVVSSVYLPKLFIHHCYHGVIVIWGSSKFQVKIHKTEGPVKSLIAYLGHIKTLWCHIGVIYMQQHLTWRWIQCVHIHHPSIHCHNGNVCCIIVLLSHVLIFQTNDQISIIPTHILQ